MLVSSSTRKSLGFTLIELMIAIALFGILATLAFPNYRDMIQNNQIRNAAESIQTGLQIARGEAVKRNASVQFDLRGSHSAWTVCTRPSPAAACPNPDDVTTVQSRGVSEGSSNNVDVASTDAGPFVFSSLGVMISPVPVAASGLTSIDVTNSVVTGLRNLRVVISVGGSSRMCDPDPGLSASDPRKCP